MQDEEEDAAEFEAGPDQIRHQSIRGHPLFGGEPVQGAYFFDGEAIKADLP